jgi:hypothetical protein
VLFFIPFRFCRSSTVEWTFKAINYTSRIRSNLKKETPKTWFADLYSLCTKPDPDLTFPRSLEPDPAFEAQNTAFCKICEVAVIKKKIILTAKL